MEKNNNITKGKIYIAVIISVMLILSHILLVIRQQQKNISVPPDLERIISVCPPDWHLIKTSASNDFSKKDALQEYDMVTSRIYEGKSGDQIQILMTWSRDGLRRAGHIQQVCYTASGLLVSQTENQKVQIKSRDLEVTTFVANGNGGLVEDVAYWRITGGELEKNITSGLSYYYLIPHRIDKLKRLIRILYGEMPYNIMVRVSSVRTKPDVNSQKHLVFIKNYLERLIPSDRKLLTGF